MSTLTAHVCPECGAQVAWNERRHLRRGRTEPYDWCTGTPVKIEVVPAERSVFVVFVNYDTYEEDSPIRLDDGTIKGWATREAAQESIDSFNAEAKRLHTVRLPGEVQEVRVEGS